MKLDIFKSSWLDLVFDGKNKAYGAYQLRKDSPKYATRAFIVGTIVFSLLVSAPLIASMMPESSKGPETIDEQVVLVDLPEKVEEPELPKDAPPPPPPPPRVDQVKFVKPVVAKKEEVTEEPPKVEDLVDKKIGKEDIKGDPNAKLTVDEPVGTGPVDAPIVEDDAKVYNMAGIQVKPSFPGGMEKFYQFIGKNYKTPEEDGLKGRVIVSFTVEKDGSLTDIKVLRDIGYGTGEEAVRVLKKSPKWAPGEQNGKKVRCTYQLPITIQSAN